MAVMEKMNQEKRKVRSYKDLIVWQKSMDLVELVYKLTQDFPSNEMYGLTSQMRRAAISIPSNIAEGSRRSSKKDYRYFLHHSYASGAELETQLLLSLRLHYSDVEIGQKISSILDEVMKMLNVMIDRLHPTHYKLPTFQ